MKIILFLISIIIVAIILFFGYEMDKDELVNHGNKEELDKNENIKENNSSNIKNEKVKIPNISRSINKIENNENVEIKFKEENQSAKSSINSTMVFNSNELNEVIKNRLNH